MECKEWISELDLDLEHQDMIGAGTIVCIPFHTLSHLVQGPTRAAAGDVNCRV